MRKKKHIVADVLLFCLSLLCASVYAADYAVGRIESFSGDVWLDSFGSGEFARVKAAGTPLYKNSVLKSGYPGNAVITVMELKKEILPETETSVARILALESKKKGAPWFTPLVNILHKITGYIFPDEKNVDFVSRGEPKFTEYDDLFCFEEETDESTAFTAELDFLLKTPETKKAGYAAGEYDYRKGFCYFQLANYEAAARLFDAAYAASEKNTDKARPYFANSLLFMTGIAHYMLADYSLAADYLEKFISRNPGSGFTAYASWLMIDSLANMKKPEEIRARIAQTEQYFKTNQFRDVFKQYLESLNLQPQN